MLVSDINRQYPQCRSVFEKHGLAGCGGTDGPPEPLHLFAAAHRVPLPALMQELEQARRGHQQPAAPPVASAAQAESLYKPFLWSALAVGLTLGFGLGLVNLWRIVAAGNYFELDGWLKQLHGHAQIFGWIGLFIMGVAYHALPRMKMQPLRPLVAAPASLWLMLAGLTLRVGDYRPLLLVSAAFELLAVGLFVALIADVARRSTQPRESCDKFIVAGLVWFLILAAGQLWIVWRGRPALWHALWIQAALFGFVANMIFGFSLRILPHFLGLREAPRGATHLAFWPWNLAILCRYPLEPLAGTASVLEAVGALAFVYALGIFAPRRVRLEIAGVDNAFGRFIVLGYVWLLVAAATPFHADVFRLSASARHLMALGFITPILFGVSYRVVPIFNGVNLWSARLMRVSFWLPAAGTTLPLAMAFNHAYETRWSYLWAGAAGSAASAAVVLWTLNLIQTLRVRAERYRAGAPVRPSTRVAELLEALPALRPVLIQQGLTGLAGMHQQPPRFVTLEWAARRHGLDPAALVQAINHEIENLRSAQ